MTDVENALRGCEPAEAVYREFGTGNFARNIEMGNILRSVGRLADAAILFRESYRINPFSKDALLVSMETELDAGLPVEDSDIRELTTLSKDFASYFLARKAKSLGQSSDEIVRIIGNGFEGFETGSAADWLFLRAAIEIVPNSTLPTMKPVAKPNLFFYWDKETRPSEIDQNIAHHERLGIFNVQPFSREKTYEFLLDYYGLDTATLFGQLRHPSEESDFFRFHAIYAFGGYYLDVDEQIVSVDAFYEAIGEGIQDVYVLADSGPIQSAFFGAPAKSWIIDEAIRVLMVNCIKKPDLSMWLKTGPGPITRALSRTYYRHLKYGTPMPDLRVLPALTFPKMLVEVLVSYRGDDRDWRVFEANRNK